MHLRIAVAISLLPTLLFAVTTGSIRGRVTDEASAPLPGVRISVRLPGRDLQAKGTVTDADGVYVLPDLPPGEQFEVTASLAGHASTTITDVVVVAGRATPVAIVLGQEANLREHVRVHAQTDLIDTSITEDGPRFSAEFIDSLPLFGRNYQDVLTLAPGVTDVDGDGNPNIHGARDTGVITLIDGINATDPLTGKMGLQLNIESIQEIEVKTSAASAEFSRAQGGFANILTKSGGNQFEGMFKFLWRGQFLDGDGAGSDPPELHANLGEQAIGDLDFNDLLGFLSFSGPLVRDRAWFFLTLEAVKNEEPVNAITNAYLATTKEQRLFAKATWQATPNNRLVFSFHADPQQYLNEGLDSFTKEETGYTRELGGMLLTLRDVAILSPQASLETTFGFNDGSPGIVPNIGPDTNGNSRLFDDWNDNGFPEAKERDGGEDFDKDGRFDIFEDPIRNGQVDMGEDLDGDGVITTPYLCEGASREDIDCDGRLDTHNEDENGNGVIDFLLREDIDFDGFLDLGNEDRNGNGILDDTPWPASDYPYGHRVPVQEDRTYELDLVNGVTSGPYYEELNDDRRRATLKQDLSLFVPDSRGTHDIKIGYVVEREDFSRDTESDDLIARRNFGAPWCILRKCASLPGLPPQVVHAILPVERDVHAEADGQTAGLYLQDSYRPAPGLSIDMGVRIDREVVHSSGYSPFDPVTEAMQSQRLSAFQGRERGVDDLVSGNGDGVVSLGIVSDPMARAGDFLPPLYSDLIDQLGTLSVRSLTGPRSAVAFASPQLNLLLADLGADEFDAELAASLGLRFQTPESFGITNTNLSPRLAVAWDPTNDGRSRIFATWGRFYDRLFLSTVVAEQGPDRVARYYEHDKYGVDIDRDSLRGWLTVNSNHHVGERISYAPASIHQVDRNLKTPYSDELTFGFEREIRPEMVLAVRYIRRDYRDQLQDIDVNHEFRIDPITGEPADRLGRLPAAQFAGQTIPRQADGRPDLFIQNFFFNEVLQIGNYNKAGYKAIEVELRRRLARRWEMLTSYTYSRAVGAAEDFQSRLGNDPSTVESEFGYLDFDQRHVVKLNLSTYLPGDWQIGFAGSWSSGLPYSVVSRFFALDNTDYQQYRTRYGFTEFDGESIRFHTLPRNSERNDAVWDLNLKVRKNFVVAKSVAAVTFEVFNLLNTDDLTISSFEPNRLEGFEPGEFTRIASPTTIDGTRRFGRRFQIGVQFQF